MILVIGGAGAGKREFARSLGYAENEMTDRMETDAPVLYGLEEIVRAEPEKADALVEPLCRRELVLCCEVGSGVIPGSREERVFREKTGRLCVLLAQRADAVVRVVAGIPAAIKGEMPCARS
ncbi:MAG: bifunctional adenosylcobinamide kinase/adenosylcobinamide-phosphate guanylyltransferase [Oscillospiraceae bacterium]|nr:bifunctional adenosylcobinamide kinase/adenosylcobinamide-phosphate guanylyltransferase [Oscillospiraceae bacterium]